MFVWASGRYGTSSGRLTGNRKSFDLQAMQNLLKHFWIVVSLVKQHLYIQVILSKQNEANHKLTDLFIYLKLLKYKCFCHLVLQPRELVNLTILAKKKKISLSSEFLEAKNQIVKKMYLRGALDSRQFFIAWEKKLSIIKMQQENLAYIRQKLSIIYKHI
jgi:hypothetical protein